jgi:hypothetical protein
MIKILYRAKDGKIKAVPAWLTWLALIGVVVLFTVVKFGFMYLFKHL